MYINGSALKKLLSCEEKNKAIILFVICAM